MANKKGAMYIAYIFLVLMTVGIATFIILWGKSTTEMRTEETINLASGRLECRDIRIDAVAENNCQSITISNKGALNIHHVRVVFDSSRQVDSDELIVGGNVQLPDEGYSGANILPIIQERGNLFGCVDKKLIINCP